MNTSNERGPDHFDKTIKAFEEMAKPLSQLTPEQRERVLRSLCVLFEVDTTEWEP